MEAKQRTQLLEELEKLAVESTEKLRRVQFIRAALGLDLEPHIAEVIIGLGAMGAAAHDVRTGKPLGTSIGDPRFFNAEHLLEERVYPYPTEKAKAAVSRAEELGHRLAPKGVANGR